MPILVDLIIAVVAGAVAFALAWFALCSVVFGGRLLRPTAAAETVQTETNKTARRQPAAAR